MPNPFEEGGPRYGNAYDMDTMPQRMPSPTLYQPNVNVSSYRESNKVLAEEGHTTPEPVNAYQYSGTSYGQQGHHLTDVAASPPPPPEKVAADPEAPVVFTEETRHKPSRLRVLFRLLLMIFAVGYLGFSAGATPYSKQPIPFDNKATFYVLYAIAGISFAYSAYHVILYLFRRFGNGRKLKRYMLIGFDFILALMWGICIIIEIIKYQCPPGDLDGWCDFYNTSIFFGFISFAMYVLILGWDIVGTFINRKKA